MLRAGSWRAGYFAVDERRAKGCVFRAKEVVDGGPGGKHHWSEDLKVSVDAPVEGVGEGRGAGKSQPLEVRLEVRLEQGRVPVWWAMDCYGLIRWQ